MSDHFNYYMSLSWWKCLITYVGQPTRRIVNLRYLPQSLSIPHNFVFANQNVRWKSRTRGGLDQVESSQLQNYASDILKLLSGRHDRVDKEIKRWRNDLSGVLFQFAKRDDKENLVSLFDRISKARHANEASYTIMMRYYADQNDLFKVKGYFKKMERDSVLFHGRSFVPLINVCLKLKEYNMAFEYFDKLLETSKKTYINTAFIDIINTCTELVNIDNNRELTRLVEGALHTMEEFGSEPLDSNGIDVLNKWFHSESSKNWSVNEAKIEKNGICPSCNTNIQTIFISEERLIRLKRNLMAFVESTIALKKNSRIADIDRKRRITRLRDQIQRQSGHYEFFDTLITGDKDVVREIASTKRSFMSNPEIFSVLGKLEEFLDQNGPFDVVIDALNIGYYTKGFDSLQVRDVIDAFKDKKCLVLCAGILKEGLLTQNPVPKANLRIKQLLVYLKKHYKLFFVGSSVLDDYYILYTILYHDFNIQLVTRDLFRDHLFHLDAENKVDFQRWQAANQLILQSFTDDNKPIFSELSKLKVAVQRHKNGWHFPKTRHEWVCVHQK